MEVRVGHTYKAVFESSNGYKYQHVWGEFEFSCRGVSVYMCLLTGFKRCFILVKAFCSIGSA